MYRPWFRELLRKLPYGLNTPLRERGGNLSSGEQLLSVARGPLEIVVLIMDKLSLWIFNRGYFTKRS